jgi:hypothetical protein
VPCCSAEPIRLPCLSRKTIGWAHATSIETAKKLPAIRLLIILLSYQSREDGATVSLGHHQDMKRPPGVAKARARPARSPRLQRPASSSADPWLRYFRMLAFMIGHQRHHRPHVVSAASAAARSCSIRYTACRERSAAFAIALTPCSWSSIARTMSN